MPSAVGQVLLLYVGLQLHLCSELQGIVSSLGSWRLLVLLPLCLPVVDLGCWMQSWCQTYGQRLMQVTIPHSDPHGGYA